MIWKEKILGSRVFLLIQKDFFSKCTYNKNDWNHVFQMMWFLQLEKMKKSRALLTSTRCVFYHFHLNKILCRKLPPTLLNIFVTTRFSWSNLPEKFWPQKFVKQGILFGLSFINNYSVYEIVTHFKESGKDSSTYLKKKVAHFIENWPRFCELIK